MDIQSEIKPALEAARQAKAAIEQARQLLEIGSPGSEVVGELWGEPYSGEKYAASLLSALSGQCSLDDCIAELEEYMTLDFRAEILREIEKERAFLARTQAQGRAI